MVWLHSSPISVVQKAGRGKHTVDEAGIDFVVQNILYALVTAKYFVEDITDKLATKPKVDIDHGEDYDEDNFKKDDDKDNSQDRKKDREGGPTQSSNQITGGKSSSSTNVHGNMCMPLTEYNVKNLVRSY